MTFEEMKIKYDNFEAFNDYITVEKAEYIGVIPENFRGVFSTHCSCGSEMIINFPRTKLSCCNPRCYVKQGLALSELFKRFNVKGIAEATCSDVYNMLQQIHNKRLEEGQTGLFETDSFVEVLLVEESVYPAGFRQSAMGNDFLYAVQAIKKQILTFPEMIAKLGLPEFDTTAYKLFNEIRTFNEFVDTIKQDGGISSFCNKRGVYAPMKKFWLQVSLSDIVVATHIFAPCMRMVGLNQLNVCITGSLNYNNSKITKDSFIALCNNNAYARGLDQLLDEAIPDNYDISQDEAVQLLKLFGNDLIPASTEYPLKKETLIQHVRELDIMPIQVLEIKMTSAKKSVPYIIADYKSNSSKYLEGLQRGEEYDEEGNKHKVLVTSNDFMDIVKSKVRRWEEEMIKSCQKTLTIKTPLTVQQMMNF